jgi:excisionase family DNA binding protein
MAKEAARYLSVSQWKLRNLVQDGRLPAIIGEGTAPWLFDMRDLDAYIDTAKTRL